MRTSNLSLRGFSLLEALIVLAITALVAAVVVVGVGKTTTVAETTKLEQDVAALNSAVRIFKANGGKIANSWKVDKVLEELKTKADAETGGKLAGLRGSMLDARVKSVDETFEEAASGEPKALWDTVNHRFYVSRSPVRGVKRFIMDDTESELATSSRARTVNLALSDGDGWVWGFTDNPSNVRNPPRGPDGGFTDEGGGTGNGTGPGLPGPLQLNEPVSVGDEEGTYDLVDFPVEFEVEDQNPEGSSTVMVSTDGQNWEEYTDPIPVNPGDTIYTYSDSNDEDDWTDSEVEIHTYSFNKVALQIALAFDKPSYSYADLGGALAGGTPGSGANRGLISLVNDPARIPTSLLNSDSFKIQYTNDGSSPVDGNILYGAPFSGTWNNQPVALSHGLWGQSGSTVTVSAVAQSYNSTYIDSSPIHTQTVAIERIQLREPVAAIYGSRVALSLVTQFNDMPVGARIVFNVNGVDPGLAGGEPTTGVLYSGGQIHLDEEQILVARVYAPSGYNNWFIASSPVTIHGNTLEGGSEDEENDDPTLVTNDGLLCGHLDVTTSSFLAEIGYGTVDGHVHRYDDEFQTVGVDFFHALDEAIHNINRDIQDSNTRFKLIISNPDLSTGGRVVINTPYTGANTSYVGVRSYASTALGDLPVFSLSGVSGTTQLSDLQIYFDSRVAPDGGIVPTTTDAVKRNLPGRNGEWRNGALTIQAVRVNEDGTPAFTTDLALSAGGVHGVARSGLLWEANLYLNTGGLSYSANTTWTPGTASAECEDPADCCSQDCVFTEGSIGYTTSGDSNSANQARLATLIEPGASCSLSFLYKDSNSPYAKTKTYSNLNFLGNLSGYRAIYVGVKAGTQIHWYEYSPANLVKTFSSGTINVNISYISFYAKTCSIPCGGDVDDWLISGYAGGVFYNPTGDNNMTTNLTGNNQNSYFSWGTRHTNNDVNNYGQFTGSVFDGVGVGDRFLLGTMTYRNGTTTLGTNATAVDFSVDIAFQGGAITKTFDFNFGLYSTPNDTGSNWGDADYFRLTDIASSATVNIFGQDYRLDLSFGQTTSNGFSTIDEFHIFENNTGYGELWGTLIRF